MNERQRIEQRIIDLTAKFNSTSSSTGDYRIIKCLEAKAMGQPMPYNFDELVAERQKIRDEINQLQAQLATMPASMDDDM